MKVNHLEHILGHGWEIVPAGGATGEAFLAIHGSGRLFLKRNSSPFLAVLSAEGIVPKLVWTKRLENGDVITAQQWLEGRELKPLEMGQEKVAKMLQKIHCSRPLLAMLERLGKKPLDPAQLLKTLKEEMNSIDKDFSGMSIVESSFQFLTKELENIQFDEQVVCHCDINHNNWLLADDGQLFLIDWDGALIGDPAIDLGMLLYTYVPNEEWEEWCQIYGIELDDHLRLRMKWYYIAQMLFSIRFNLMKERMKEVEKGLLLLEEIL